MGGRQEVLEGGLGVGRTVVEEPAARGSGAQSQGPATTTPPFHLADQVTGDCSLLLLPSQVPAFLRQRHLQVGWGGCPACLG